MDTLQSSTPSTLSNALEQTQTTASQLACSSSSSRTSHMFVHS